MSNKESERSREGVGPRQGRQAPHTELVLYPEPKPQPRTPQDHLRGAMSWETEESLKGPGSGQARQPSGEFPGEKDPGAVCAHQQWPPRTEAQRPQCEGLGFCPQRQQGLPVFFSLNSTQARAKDAPVREGRSF